MKRYIIALLMIAGICGNTAAFAQTAKKKSKDGCPIVYVNNHRHHVKHHMVRKEPMAVTDATFFVDDPTSTGIVEIRDGNLYINDSFVARVSNPRHDDYKVVLNYTAPVIEVDHDKEYTGYKAEKPLLGVFTTNECDGGAIVDKILPGGPADKAGLDYGDVITKINDRDINNSEELVEAINKYGAGDKVTVTYRRMGRTETAETEFANAANVANCTNNEGQPCGCRRPYRKW